MRRRLRGPGRFESRIVWIFGSPRSGSTWLWTMLREFDPIVAMNEPMIGFYLSPFACDAPGVRASSLDAKTFTVRRVQADRPEQFFAESFADVWRPLLRELLTERLRAYAARKKPNVPMSNVILAVKEPNGSQSADIIMSAQPEARLLFLLRDGRDVIDSQLAGSAEGAWTSERFPGVVGIPASERLWYAEVSAYKWLWRTEVVQEAYDKHPGPKLLLRYEDLRRDPHHEMLELLRWMDVGASAAEVHSVVDRHAFEKIPEENRGPDRFFRSARPGSWRENLTQAEQDLLEQILGPKLRELGYEA